MISWTFFGDGLYPDFWFGLDRPAKFLFQDLPPFDDQFEIIVWSINTGSYPWSPPPISGVFAPPDGPTFPPQDWTFTLFADLTTPIPANAEILLTPGDYQVIPIWLQGTNGLANVALVPIPELSTWALMLLGVGLFFLHRNNSSRRVVHRAELDAK